MPSSATAVSPTTAASAATAAVDACWTLVAGTSAATGTVDPPAVQEVRQQLEKGTDAQKVDAMKRLLQWMLNGDPAVGGQLMMHVIRFVLPSRNKALKKLLLVYWEICPKKNAHDGKLKQEMILVCNYIRNDLQSPNEFVRGATLRLICKLREPEILEPLLPSCRQSLTHRTPYVRKNAIQAIYTVYKHYEHLIPDGPEVIHEHLKQESDPVCRRNAFLMLCGTDQRRALEYLQTVLLQQQQVAGLDELMQLAVIELIKKDARVNLAAKGKYVQCIVELLSTSSPAVRYEAAGALTGLTSSPVAIKEIATCYISLAVKEADNNIKLIVLDNLQQLRMKHERVLNELVMDVLRVLSSPDVEVCRKAIAISLEMLSSRNVDEVVAFFKKEIAKTYEPSNEKALVYRQMLIHAVHQCAIKFPETAADVVDVLMEFLTDMNNTSAIDVVTFVREVIERNDKLRKKIVRKLLSSFPEMKSGKVMRGALWIAGEYCVDVEEVEIAMREIRVSLGELPIVAGEKRAQEEKNAAALANGDAPASAAKAAVPAQQRRVLADGTYATESAFSSSNVTRGGGLKSPGVSGDRPPLRNLIMSGDYFLGAVLATALTKLVLRATASAKQSAAAVSPERLNAMRAEAMLIMTSVVRVGQSEFVPVPIDEDSYGRILICLRVLGHSDPVLLKAFLQSCHDVYARIVRDADKKHKAAQSNAKQAKRIAIDELISFPQLKVKAAAADKFDEYERDLLKATGAQDSKNETANRLNRIVQLTGFSDPVYAEAFVDVHQYDILLDVLVVNQTAETLQNLTIEFATLGDLKLVERPATCNMAPHSFMSIKANIKVSSTETGVIFGNIVYDGPGTGETTVIVLNDIHIDIMDYIKPATCDENQFRSMWNEFEWENKINVNTNMTDLRKFLAHIMKSTNMSCLTPEQAQSGDCGFLAVNMYARSIFGEDALANICLEQHGDTPVCGHIRIRSKTQGIALSLGDKITLSQKVKA